MITDEMIEKAHKHTCLQREWCRQVIEAVAPALIAQGMREAVKLSGEGWTIDYILAQAIVKELRDIADKVYNQDADIAETILARAQELDPK